MHTSTLKRHGATQQSRTPLRLQRLRVLNPTTIGGLAALLVVAS